MQIGSCNPGWCLYVTTKHIIRVVIFVVIPQVANMFLAQSDWGWRLSIALTGVPTLAMLLLLPALPESPQSLLQRGKHDQAIKVRSLSLKADCSYNPNWNRLLIQNRLLWEALLVSIVWQHEAWLWAGDSHCEYH